MEDDSWFDKLKVVFIFGLFSSMDGDINISICYAGFIFDIVVVMVYFGKKCVGFTS